MYSEKLGYVPEFMVASDNDVQLKMPPAPLPAPPAEARGAPDG